MTASTAVDHESPSRPGRPRSEQAERAIIEATLDLLAEVGIAGMSIEQVAARAGVGKATIYRRWPNKDALIVDAAATLKRPVPALPGESLREDLLVLAEGMRTRDLSSREGQISLCLYGEGTRYPDLVKRYFEVVIEPRREVVRDVLRQGIARGELRDEIDLEVMLVVVTSPIIHHAMSLKQRGEEMSREFAESLIDAILDGLRADSATPGSS